VLKLIFVLIIFVAAHIKVANHVEMVVVDIDNFFCVLVNKCVRYRPAHPTNVLIIDRAAIVGVMLLSGPNEWVMSRGIHVVSNFAFYDTDIVPIAFPQEWDTTFNGLGLFDRDHDFVVTWSVERDGGAARSDGPQNWYAIVPLLEPKLFFFQILKIGTYGDGHGQEVKAWTKVGEAPTTASRRQGEENESNDKVG
jgi:hypothetical protein